MAEPRYIFRDLSYARPTSQFVGGVDVLTPIEKLQRKKDEADAMSGFVKPVDSLNPDLQRRDARLNYYKDELAKASDYESPYEQQRAVRKLAQAYADEMHQGELGTIANRYAQREEYRKRLLEGVEKKRFSQSKADKLLNIADAEYERQKGIGEKSNLGAYNPYTAKEAVSDVNVIEEMDKITKGIMADKYSTTNGWGEVADATGRRFFKNTRTGETVKFEDAYNLAKQAAESHPDILPFLEQEQFIKSYGREITPEHLEMFAAPVKNNKGEIIGEQSEILLGKGNTVEKLVTDYMEQGASEQEAISKAYNQLAIKANLHRNASQIAGKYAYDEVGNNQDMSHEKTAEWEAKRAAKIGEWEPPNPIQQYEDIINNPYAVPEISSIEKNTTFNQYMQSNGFTGSLSLESSSYSPTGSKGGMVYYDASGKRIDDNIVANLQKEYKLLQGSITDYVNSPLIKNKYGDLPSQIASSIPKGNMSDEQYKNLVLGKVNEVIKANKTAKVTLDIIPVDQANEDTKTFFGDIKESSDGNITGGLGTIMSYGIWHNGKLTDFESLAKELGTTVAKLASNSRITGRARADNPLAPAARSFTTVDGEGNPIKLMIDNQSVQAAKARQPLHDLSAVLYDLKLPESKTVDLSGRKVKSTPVDIWIDKDGKQVVQYNNNGNYITQKADSKRPITLSPDMKYSHRVAMVDEDNDSETPPVIYILDENGKATLGDVSKYTDAIDVYKNLSSTKSISSDGKKDVNNKKIAYEIPLEEE